VCLEILQRINQSSFAIAHAVMHTTGQAFMMAFRPAARTRRTAASRPSPTPGTRCGAVPAVATWEKPQGKKRAAADGEALPHRARGVGLVIGLLHVPDVERLSGLFASLATGQRGRGQAAPEAIAARE